MIKWMLIYIVIKGGTPYAVNAQGPYVTFDTMYECFDAREILSETIGPGNGSFKPGHQAICIQIKSNV